MSGKLLSDRAVFVYCALLAIFANGNLFCSALLVRDDLPVPYVPHVVLNNTKPDDFNYDSLQETISRYLNSVGYGAVDRQQQRQSESQPAATSTGSTLIEQSSERGMTLYNYLKNADDQRHRHDDDSQNDRLPDKRFNSFITPNSPTFNLNRTPNQSPVASANFNRNWYSRVAVPTYRPASAVQSYYQVTEGKENVLVNKANNHPFTPVGQASSNAYTIRQSPVVQLNDRQIPSPVVPDRGIPMTNMRPYQAPMFSRPNATPYKFVRSDLSCNVRSVRLIRDGDCISRRSILDTACAEKCSDYEPKNVKRKLSEPLKRHHVKILSVQQYPSESLRCIEGDTKRINVKLHCKNGTVKSTVIRTVKDCVCLRQENEINRGSKRRIVSSNQGYKFV